ncbi:MAG TPA: terminase small subunit [Stellaceae bacterium]|nr:terminase small subunit [Stellaceae bacterium]
MTTLPPRMPLRASRPSRKPDRPLTPKQTRFVDEYLLDMNASAAARRAGYRETSAAQNGHGLARRPNVAAAIEARLAERRARLHVTAERVIAELARIAFADIGAIMDWSADATTLKPPGEISPDDRAAIAEIAVVKRGDGVATRVVLHDKERALEALCRHLGLFARAGQSHSPSMLGQPAPHVARADELREMLRAKIEKRVAERVEEALAARAAAEREAAQQATEETAPEST